MKIQREKHHLFSLFVRLSIVYSVLFVTNVKTACGAVSDSYYYSSGRKNMLPLSKKMVAVRFKPEVTSERQRAIAESQGTLPSFSERKELPVFKITLLSLRQVATEETIIQTIDSLNANEDVEFANPVFDFPDAELTLTDEFIVKFTPSVTKEEIEAFNRLNGVETARKEKWAEWYVLRVKDPRNMNALKMANLYYESPITIYSVPNFVRRLEPMSVTPNDTYFQQQWALHNGGQIPPGGTQDADIDAPEGWEISTGSPDIVIAIIDEGVDITHEDLVNKLVAGYDFVENDNDPSPWNNDAHGTACAGLAAGQTNNTIGVAGVAWGCKIMPIRIAYGYGGGWWYYDTWIAGGIQWAADNRADVLSNSWGGGSPSDAITEAVQYAKNYGRGGKGCVVVFAAGNSGSYVAYPAWLDEVIAVGATDHDDERWDYSNFGSELDVVAPSGLTNLQGNIWTTDITGSAGYNNRNPDILDYTDKMGGTSAAAPQVAGLAALILSVNPDLTSDEVQFFIESTADDKGTTGWDQYYGWGRINVYKALIEAAKNEQILRKVDDVNDGDSVLPDEEITYTIHYANPVTDENDPNYIGTLTGVTIVDYLPQELDPNNPFDPAYSLSNHRYVWNIGTLSPGNSNSIQVRVIVNELAEPLGKITNVCVLRANEIGPVTSVEVTDVNSWNPGIVYVNKQATGSNTGMSWNNVYRCLHKALERGQEGCGSEIWVAAGTYKPDTNAVDPNKYATFELADGVGLYGGFAGNETSREQRNPLANQTILTGDIDNDDTGDIQDVVTALGIGQTTIIDGFTITKGLWSGLWCDPNSSPIIANNTFKANWDGVDCNGTPTIINCIVENNSRYGIFCLPNSSPTITNNIIRGNGGNGIYCQEIGEGVEIEIKNNWIHSNGNNGIYIYNPDFYAPAIIRNNTIVNNAGYGINSLWPEDANISNCIAWYNSSGQLYSSNGTFEKVRYSCIQNGDTNNGNINIDPLFYNDPNDPNNFHLSSNSPCIDAGNPFADYAGETDIDGEGRVKDGNADGIERVDMGADEYYWSPADFNDDRIVNFIDYARFANAWDSNDSNSNWDPICNIGIPANNRIDYNDLAVFCEDWLWQAGWTQLIGFMMMGQGMSEEGGVLFAPAETSLQAVSAEQQIEKVEPLKIEQLIKWLEELWLTDSEVRKTIDKAPWQKFMDSIKDGV